MTAGHGAVQNGLGNRLLLEAAALCTAKGRTDDSSDVRLLREAAAALAAPGEAVAWQVFTDGSASVTSDDVMVDYWREQGCRIVPLYALPAARVPEGWRDDVNTVIQLGTCHEMSSQDELHRYVDARDRLLNMLASAPPVAEREE